MMGGNFLDYNSNDPLHDPNHDYERFNGDSNHDSIQSEHRNVQTKMSDEEIKNLKSAQAIGVLSDLNKKYSEYRKRDLNDKLLELLVQYEKVAAMYVEILNHKEAADCYEFIGTCYEEFEKRESAAKTYYNAGLHYSKINDIKYMTYMIKAIELFNELENFSRSAQISTYVADYCRDTSKYDEAVKFYEYTYKLYKYCGFKKFLNPTRSKLAFAYIKINPPKYEKAANLLEKIGNDLVALNEEKSAVFFTNALAATMMLGNIKSVADKFEQYDKLSSNFGSSPQCTFIVKIAESIHCQKYENFNEALTIFKSVFQNNAFLTCILSELKTHFFVISSSSARISQMQHVNKQYNIPSRDEYENGKYNHTTNHMTNHHHTQHNRHHTQHNQNHYGGYGNCNHYGQNNYGYKQQEKKYVSNYNTDTVTKSKEKQISKQAGILDYEIRDIFDGSDFDVFS